MSIIDELHHRGRYDETSARSARQSGKFILRWLREVRIATSQLRERMLQEDTDIAINVCAV
jgi:hypothetical protein